MTSSARQNNLQTHAATAHRSAPSAGHGNDGARDLLPIKQLRVSAMETTMTKPAGAMSSVFDVQKPPRKKRESCLPVDVKIIEGVPLPPLVNSRPRIDIYGDLLRRMKDGDMVLLDKQQAASMRARAKKLGIEAAVRLSENGKFGVWRVGLVASSSDA